MDAAIQEKSIPGSTAITTATKDEIKRYKRKIPKNSRIHFIPTLNLEQAGCAVSWELERTG